MGAEGLRRIDGAFRRMTPFRLFALAGIIGTLAISGGSIFASQRAGEAEAMADVRELTAVVAKTVVEPALSPVLLSGDSAAVAALDQIVQSRVLDETTVRVKLWDSTGRIVYSDEARLIGEIAELGPDKLASLQSGAVISEISSLEGRENRFETSFGQLLEVYLPITAPDGQPVLYESYFALSSMSDASSRIRAEFLPILLAALLLMEALHLGLAWGLNRRMRRDQRERERLMQRAIYSSDVERRRIAGDLHDGVVQDLVGTSFALAAAADSAERHAPELSSDLRAAAVGTRRSVQSLRSLLVDIYPPNLYQHGLEAALVDLLEPARSQGIVTELTITGESPSQHETIALVYRVAQEAARNAIRHADPSRLTIDVQHCADLTSVTISDDGVGFSPEQVGEDGHFGLRLLGDLATDAGAQFTVVSEPEVGTTVRIEVPG